MTDKVRRQIVQSQEAMEKSRRRRTTLFDKRKEINRVRTKIERQRMELLQIRTPHQLEASKLERRLKDLQQLEAKLGLQYETSRARGLEADEKLKEVCSLLWPLTWSDLVGIATALCSADVNYDYRERST